jgi:hypothetical protein
MIKEFEYEGIWWLPGSSEEQICGTLKFSPKEGATLDLIGSFNDPKKIVTGMQNFPIILGTTVDGKEITLTNCSETTNTTHIPGIETSSFYSPLVFKGVHFQKLEDIRFRNIFVHYSHLDNWVGISGFDISYGSEDNDEIVIKYKKPKPIQFDVGDYKISIVIKNTYPTHTIVQKEASIKQTTYIKIEPPEEKSLDEYRSAMLDIKNFLSLGVGEPVYLLIVEGTTEKNKQVIEEGKPLYYPIVEIFYRVSDILETREVLASQMLFTFKDVKDRFEIFLRNWFKKTHLLKPTFTLYFGVLYNSHLYLESEFLSLTQAIESYHQRIYGDGKYLSEKEYKAVYDALVEAIPEKTKDRLKDRLKDYLKYGNEFNLRTRIKEILDSYSDLIGLFIKDEGKFVNDVVETRNYLTHYDKDSKPPSPVENYGILFQLIQNLRTIVEICLLKEAGFSLEEIKGLFSRNRYMMFLRNNETIIQ